MRQFVLRHGSKLTTGLALAALLSISAGTAAWAPITAAAPGRRPAPAQQRGAPQPAGFAPPAAPGPLASNAIGSEWQPFVPGVVGYVAVMVSTGTDIYVGGHFTQAGALLVNNIARWNTVTHQWYALGNGVLGPSFSTSVNAMFVDGSDLYIGGDFGTAGGVTANYVARWNTVTGAWYSLGAGAGNGVDFPVYALARLGNALFVGGRFQHAGGAPALGLAQWDPSGQSWSAVGSGVTNGVHGYVYSLLATGTDMYVGGAFDRAGPLATTNVARWNGSWSALGLGTSSSLSDVQSLAISGTTLYVGGTFASVSDGALATSANNIAAWNTTQHTWSALGAGVTGGSFTAVTSLATGPQGLYAVGDYTQAAAPPPTASPAGTGANGPPCKTPSMAAKG